MAYGWLSPSRSYEIITSCGTLESQSMLCQLDCNKQVEPPPRFADGRRSTLVFRPSRASGTHFDVRALVLTAQYHRFIWRGFGQHHHNFNTQPEFSMTSTTIIPSFQPRKPVVSCSKPSSKQLRRLNMESPRPIVTHFMHNVSAAT